MVFTFPLSLPSLADKLPIETVIWGDQRSDELSGTGDGRIYQAELAGPLWTGEVSLAEDYHQVIKQIAAIIRKLQGAQNAFMLYDPLSTYPQADPDGSILGASTVQVHTVGASNQAFRLKGLPSGYVLTIGDKGQIAYSSDPVRNFFFEVSETVAAAGTSITPEFEIFPHVPVGVVADAVVTLIRPACKVIILPGTFSPGRARGITTAGAAFKVIQKK